jgi:hypothetical protein
MLAIKSLPKLIAVSSCFLFLTLSSTVAQTGTATTPPPDPATEKPAKPAPKHTPPAKSTAAKAPAKTTTVAAQPNSAATTPAANTTSAVPARTASTAATPAAGVAAPAATSNGLPARNSTTAPAASANQPAAAPAAAAPASNAARTAPTTQGLGDFRAQDFTLTAYSCYRSGSRVLCDFDLTKQRAAQVNTAAFNNVVLVDDGGKITRRHDAYFMAADGSRMPNAYASATPVRYIMEFDDSTANASSVSLVRGNERIQNVPVSATK